MTAYFNHIRPFTTQIANTAPGHIAVYNNCWACAINAIKGRSYSDKTYLMKCVNLPGFNDGQNGYDVKNSRELFESFNIIKVPHYKYNSLIPLSGHFLSDSYYSYKIEKIVLDLFKSLLSLYGPLLLLRNARGADAIHAIAVIDIDTKNNSILVHDSMRNGALWMSKDDFLDEIFFLITALPRLLINGLCPIYYDGDFKKSWWGL